MKIFQTLRNSFATLTLTVLFSLLGMNTVSASCPSCNTMVCDGTTCDDGSTADGVQTSRQCSCGSDISGACAYVEMDLSGNPYYDPNDPNSKLYLDSQESGNFSIYYIDATCTIADCSSPDFVISSGAYITGFPTTGLIRMIVCKNGGNAGRRDFSFTVSSSTIEHCSNGVDDDGDGFVDCDDPDCNGDSTCGSTSTSGGDDSGLESNSRLADKIATRQYRRAKANAFNRNTRLPQLRLSQGGATYREMQTAADLMAFIPVDAIPNTETYISTPADLVNITNATEVFSVDVYANDGGQRMGAILATASEGGPYEHTKYICDRLHGARVENIWSYALDGEHPFIVTKFRQPSGLVEYSCNFSFFADEMGDYQLHSHWNLAEYPPNDHYYTFQIWADNITHLSQLATAALQQVGTHGAISGSDFGLPPNMFVEQLEYANGELLLHINNSSSSQQLLLQGNSARTEQGESVDFSLDYSLAPSARQSIPLTTEGVYSLGVTLHHDNATVADAVYFADGAWGLDYNPAFAEISGYLISEGRTYSPAEGYAVERNVSVSGSASSTVAAYRALNAAFRPVDLSQYNTLSFDAKGVGDLEIRVVKGGVEAWEDQMRTSVRLDPAGGRVELPLSRFHSPSGESDWTDARMLVFSLTNNDGEYRQFEMELGGILFSQQEKQADYSGVFGGAPIASPNPMTDQTRILFAAEGQGSYTFSLYSHTGRTLQELSGEAAEGINELSIRNQNYPPGHYFYKISLEGGESLTGKLVILE